MRRTLVIVVVLLAGFAFTSASTAATPTEKKLQRQVAALQKQVKKLQADVRVARGIAIVAGGIAYCSTAITADTFQGTWAALNAKLGDPALFPTETPINDAGICQALRITRAPTANPPSLAVHKALFSSASQAVAALL